MSKGVTIIVPATRRIPPQCLESKAKITNKMNHIIATFEARQADPKAIPLMLDLDGNIAESNAHNFFAVIDGKVYTPGSKNVLGGITRAVLGELAEPLDLEVEEADLTPYDCLNADEAFLTSTSPTIVPIKSINGVEVPVGRPGSRDGAAAQGLVRPRGRRHRRPGHQPHGGGEGRLDGRVEREAGGAGALVSRPMISWHNLLVFFAVGALLFLAWYPPLLVIAPCRRRKILRNLCQEIMRRDTSGSVAATSRPARGRTSPSPA